MKLQDYFHHQKHTFLTDTEKFSLYQQIIAKRDTRKSFLQRYAFAKRFAYASFVALFFVMVYGVHFFRDDLRYMTNSLIVQRGGDTVQAGYIAQIVHFDGGFFIEHQGKQLQTSVIRDGDIVTLKNNTEMTFHIDDQTQAKLVGPAQFMLNQKGEGDDALYTLQLLYGNFVEMESLNEETTQNIALVSKDVTIHQEKKDKASHFQLISDGETQRIENKGAQIIVTSLQDDKSIETEIHNKQTLSIASNDITLIDDETQITRILTQKDVSQTIAFADVKEKIEQPEEITAAALSEVFEEVDVKVDARVAAAIDTMITKQSDGKKIPTTEQDKQLRSNLYGGFLNPDAQALLVAYVLGDDASVQKYTQIFGDRLTNIAKAFDVELRKTTGLQGLVAASSDIKQSLSATYYIPPRYMDNIAMIGRIVSYIISQEQSKSDAKPTLPANLIFQ